MSLPPGEVSRRDFLKLLGASFAAASASGCSLRAPREKIVPHLDQTGAPAPGTARWYASTCGGCAASCGALVKSRDGRPIKLEGNSDHPLSAGGLCARGQATVLDLYDSERLRGPRARGAAASWAQVDGEVVSSLERVRKSGGRVVLVSRTLRGPSERAAAASFLKRFPGAEHVVYDPLSASAILEAHRQTHGRRLLPHYRFDRARAVAAFDADFLGTWISPVEFTRGWAKGRAPGKDMSWHAQFEPRVSVTGASADERFPLRPSREYAALATLGLLLAKRLRASGPLPAAGDASGLDGRALALTAGKLSAAPRGTALVVCGSRDARAQVLVNWINAMLGGYGSTLDLSAPSLQREGDDRALDRLVAEMKAGKVGALVVYDCNPAYDQPRGGEFGEALGKVAFSAAIADRLDETASLAQVACPLSHPLESWGDAEPVAGVVSVMQPLVLPLFDSRPGVESLLAFAGKPRGAHDFVRATWKERVVSRQSRVHAFEPFWEEAVRRGVVSVAPEAPTAPRFDPSALKALKPEASSAAPGSFELVAYAGVALADGRQANNPWLQELPDPISKAAWGNHASFSPQDAGRLGLEEGRVVRLSGPAGAAELPAHVQPGLAEGVVAAALGYGRTKAGRIAANYPIRKWLPIEQEPVSGADLYPLSRAGAVSVEPLAETSPLAKTQDQDSLTDPILGHKRPFLRQLALAEFLKDPDASRGMEEDEEGSLWPKHRYPGEKWAMAVDLNACTSCSACIVACYAENNVPVVGKAELRKNRFMSWLRVDRYYLDNPAGAGPDVASMPVMCQQCDDAPCETVCPVIATSHTSDGLNAQVYNRCVGTRYCENNCPYKCRRFNWFDYERGDQVQDLVLNPDVTVRSRGVVEKCNFCVQRIEAARIAAEAQGRPIKDGEILPACAQSCPAGGLLFGDVNDPDSRVARAFKSGRGYRLLGELGVGPSVVYQAKVRNRQA